MCNSASASFVFGGVLCLAGMLTLRKTEHHSEWVIACTPLIFGIQQFFEGLIWINAVETNTDLGRQLSGPTILTDAYLLVAVIFWPLFSPVAINLIEKSHLRKRWLAILGIPAVLTACYFIHALWAAPINDWMRITQSFLLKGRNVIDMVFLKCITQPFHFLSLFHRPAQSKTFTNLKKLYRSKPNFKVIANAVFLG